MQQPPIWSLLVRSLERGGAERQVLVLARALHERGQSVRIITFYDGGALRQLLSGTSVPVISLNKKSRWDVVGFLVRLIRTLRTRRPQVLYSFLTEPNVSAALVRPWLGDTLVVWGIRASNMDLRRYNWFARLTNRIEQVLANRVDLIVANSTAGLHHSLARGFPRSRTIRIANGIDTTAFAPDPEGRKRVRREWDIRDDHVLVGLAGRFDPMKDHETFLRAASRVSAQHENVRFVCVGTGSAVDVARAVHIAEQCGLASLMVWPGPRDDMAAVYSAFDVACSASRFGEGFSNTLAEAMSCGTPCIATDVGDASHIVADTGLIVPAADPGALADAVLKLVRMSKSSRSALGLAARSRIEGMFSVDRLARHTLEAVNQQFAHADRQ